MVTHLIIPSNQQQWATNLSHLLQALPPPSFFKTLAYLVIHYFDPISIGVF